MYAILQIFCIPPVWQWPKSTGICYMLYLILILNALFSLQVCEKQPNLVSRSGALRSLLIPYTQVRLNRIMACVLVWCPSLLFFLGCDKARIPDRLNVSFLAGTGLTCTTVIVKTLAVNRSALKLLITSRYYGETWPLIKVISFIN
jgi:hypothetical protein